MNTLIYDIFCIAEGHNLWGSISEDTLDQLLLGDADNAAMEIAAMFTGQNGGEAPDEFYEEILEAINCK